MDVSHILDPLNDAQREAVTAEPGNLLVLAGAGSGKTRVLVHRIAWLIQVEQAPPWTILAVTFTNKAAREMRGRIEEILQAAGRRHVGGHLPRPGPPPAARPLAGGRAAPELPDPGLRRPVAG